MDFPTQQIIHEGHFVTWSCANQIFVTFEDIPKIIFLLDHASRITFKNETQFNQKKRETFITIFTKTKP